MVNFYIYYNIYTHTYIYIFINIKNNGKPETVRRYWPVPKHIIPLVKSVQSPVRDWLYIDKLLPLFIYLFIYFFKKKGKKKKKIFLNVTPSASVPSAFKDDFIIKL